MIELFAELITKRAKIDFSALIKASLENDRYVRDTAKHYEATMEEIKGSERFYKIDDSHAYIKKEVYFSYFVHKMLLSMKRAMNEDNHAHIVVVCEDRTDMQHILEDQVFRILSQIQDQEYKVTDKSPITFAGRPVVTLEEFHGFNLTNIDIPRFGRISLVHFFSVLRMTEREITNEVIIRELLQRLGEADRITHFYKMDTAFQRRQGLSRGEMANTTKRLLEEAMPADCIHYSFNHKDSLRYDSYAARHSIPFALQVSEKNQSLMRVLLEELRTTKQINVQPGGYILDPISTLHEKLLLCKAKDYEYIIENADKETVEVTERFVARGVRANHIWVDEDILQASPYPEPIRIMGVDIANGEAMTTGGVSVNLGAIRSPIPETDIERFNENLRAAAENAMRTQLIPRFRYDPDGEARFIGADIAVRTLQANQPNRNQRAYSTDVMQQAVSQMSEEIARRSDTRIRDEFLRNWIEEQ